MSTEILFDLDGFTFGHATGPLRLMDWDAGSLGIDARDVEQPVRDGLLFGRDRGLAPVWTFTLTTLTADETTAREALDAFAQAWRPPSSTTPLAHSVLRYYLNGRWRRAYGRPRTITLPTSGSAMRTGRATIVATFQLADPLHYSDAESSLSLGIVPASSAGLAFPTAPPFTWRSDGAPQSRFAVVGGDAPTPLRVMLTGPVVRPWVRVGDVLVQLTGELAYDETLTVDARLMTITRADGASVPGALAPRTRMADLRLSPGSHEVTFGGSDLTGTATATVAWRDAFRSL